MNRPRKGSESFHLPTGLTPSGRGRLYKTGLFSLLLHFMLIFFLILNLMPSYSRSGRAVYRVTLKPFSPPGDGRPAGSSGAGLPGTPEVPKTPESPSKAEKSRPDETSKGSEAVETTKRDRRKAERAEKGEVPRYVKKEKKYEQPRENKLVEGLKKSDKKEMKVEREKGSGKSLQEAIEDIHKRVALDEIQKKVARRSGGEKAVGRGTLEGGTEHGEPDDRPFRLLQKSSLDWVWNRNRDRTRFRDRDRNGLGRVPLGLFLAGVETERLLQSDLGKNQRRVDSPRKSSQREDRTGSHHRRHHREGRKGPEVMV